MKGVQEEPKGLVVRPGLVAAGEEAELLGILGGLDYREVVMRGQVARRTVRHYGVDYDYDSRQVVPADPLPDWLLPLRDRAAALAGVEPEAFVEALVNRYPPGATIGWHRDAPMFGSAIAGLSLGGAARMRFQRTAAGGERRVWEVALEPRSAYVLSGSARWAWQHSIPAVKELRISITFRTLKG